MSEVGKFEEALQQHKDILVKELIKLGKNRQAEFVVWDIEKNQVDYEYYFNAGQQSQQAKVEELQKKLNEYIFVAKTLDEMYVKEVQKSDELQKRVDAVLGHLDDVNFPPDYEDAWESFYKAEQALKGEGQ